MLLKINDKRESSIKILKDVYGRQEIPDFRAHIKKGINGIINIDDNKLNGYIYMVNAIYYDRIENQYLLDINDECIEKLTKEYNINFIVNEHIYEDDSDLNVSNMYPRNYFTIDIVDIKPKRFVDVRIKRFGVRAEELTNVDTIHVPNEILDACDLLSGKYNKINIELNSENTIAEISVERDDNKIAGIKFIPEGVYSKKEKVQFALFSINTNHDIYDFFPVYVDDLLHKDIKNLKMIEDRIYDLCSRIILNNKEDK